MLHLRKVVAPLLLLALGSLARPAQAQFTTIAQPDAGYLGSTTRLDFTDPDFSVLSSLSDGTFTVNFSTDVIAATVPTTFLSWGAPPNTESSTPRVLATQDSTLTLSFSNPVGTFGLEAQPNFLGIQPITATFLFGTQTVGTIQQDVDGNGGALLFAGKSDTPFTSVVLSSSDTFAIAQLRFSAVPEPGTLALCIGLGIAGLSLRLRIRK